MKYLPVLALSLLAWNSINFREYLPVLALAEFHYRCAATTRTRGILLLNKKVTRGRAQPFSYNTYTHKDAI